MPRSKQAIYSFAGGVMSPAMSMRADSEKYPAASRYMRNWVVTPQGGITMRHGSEFIGTTKENSAQTRIFTFARDGNESDILVETGVGYTRFWLEDATLVPEGVNNYTAPALRDVQFANQENLMVQVHPSYPPLVSTYTADDDILTEEFPFNRIPERSFQDKFSPGVIVTSEVYTVDFTGSAWTDNDIFFFGFAGKFNPNPGGFGLKQYVFSTDSLATIAALEEACEDNVEIGKRADMSYVVAHVAQNQYTITLTGPAAGRNMELFAQLPENRQVTAVITTPTAVNTGAEPAWSYPYVVFHNGDYYQCLQPHLSAGATNQPGVGSEWTDFWLLLPGEPSYWQWQHGGSNQWFADMLYAPWGRGFPSTVTFHDQRLYFGGTSSAFEDVSPAISSSSPAAPSTIWGSRIGDYFDFLAGPNDDDPIAFTLATQGSPAISWMTSLQGLLVGTTAGDFRVSANITITPSSINVQKQNNARSANLTPVLVNNQVFYIQLGNTTMRMAQYQREALAVLSEEVSLIAESLFYKGITDLDLLQVPETVLLMVRNSGDIVGLSYTPETDVAAFWEWNTAGTFQDGSVVYDKRLEQGVYYVVTSRENQSYIEKIIYPPADFEDRANLDGLCYMDAFERGTITDSDTITVPTRFTDRRVRVTVNDADYGEFVAVGTTVTLPRAVTGYYYVGLSYTAECQTFERTAGNPAGVGFGTARRWNKLYYRIVDSALPVVNEQRAPDRTPSSPMDLPEPLQSSDIRHHNLGFNDGAVTIDQDIPFPTHVVGVYGQIGVNDA